MMPDAALQPCPQDLGLMEMGGVRHLQRWKKVILGFRNVHSVQALQQIFWAPMCLIMSVNLVIWLPGMAFSSCFTTAFSWSVPDLSVLLSLLPWKWQ